MSSVAEFIALSEQLHNELLGLSEELSHGLLDGLTRFPRDPEQRRALQREQAEALHRYLPVLTTRLDAAYARLTALDAGFSEDEREAALEHHRARVQPFFLQCPFIRRAADKPLGYPGDYLMVEMIFNEQDEGVSTFARLLSRYALQCGPARAHRARPSWVLQHLREHEREVGRPLRVLSFACGPEHTLREYAASGASGHFTLCDFDPAPLEYCRRQFQAHTRRSGPGVPPPPTVDYVEVSTYQLLKNRELLNQLRHPEGHDVLVVAGLLDYLKAPVAERFLDLLAPLVAPGGRVLLTNLHAHNPWRAFMEYVGDWRVLHRERAEFQALCAGLDEQRLRTLELTSDASDTNLFWAGRRG
ncbi:class I SAM-dependent methyltransferase [Pyxidicoccus parkwayensis]|uniref:Class I SAM-dependent methyltransferase n=1 Tax=Pyxidicoccus parkwayensis TaxID=2813578 RepID=A0ABX7NY11_9BACT|nr:class I SAM-dependent methyltransferase [Pyxidicoccus parkwaysis]QSQ23801.1 class I SAM-dependent methyltransferase [Pyxidicoccus parkwaysis]